MDYSSIIRELLNQRDRIDAAIANLEALERGEGHLVVRKSTRGRKSMGTEERKVVSERMKRYWARRRKERRYRGMQVMPGEVNAKG